MLHTWICPWRSIPCKPTTESSKKEWNWHIWRGSFTKVYLFERLGFCVNMLLIWMHSLMWMKSRLLGNNLGIIIGNGKCSSSSSGLYLLLPSFLQFHIMSLLTTWKRKETLAGMTWVFYIISKVSDYCLIQEIVANPLLVKAHTAWEFLRWCSWSPNWSYYQSLTTDLLHYWNCHYATIFSSKHSV